MAENARRAVTLGSCGIDINFGCPSKTVNRRQGGAVMLRDPDSLYRVVDAVRRALPPEITVSAKMRLGYDDLSLMLDNAQAIRSRRCHRDDCTCPHQAAGLRTPPRTGMSWQESTALINIPLIANGDIWTVEDYHACVATSGTTDVMLGRGAVQCPDLASRIRQNIE